MIHYVLVRRDLPLGVVCAQITHAAGESFAASMFKGDISGTIAVVLGVDDKEELHNARRRLKRLQVPHVPIYEPDAPWHGQLMAIGLVPGDAALLRPLMRQYKLLKRLGR
jgi:peptidyl-tRNA hydrolase